MTCSCLGGFKTAGSGQSLTWTWRVIHLHVHLRLYLLLHVKLIHTFNCVSAVPSRQPEQGELGKTRRV